EHQVEARRDLLAIETHGQHVGAGVRSPIDVAQVVAGRLGTVIRKPERPPGPRPDPPPEPAANWCARRRETERSGGPDAGPVDGYRGHGPGVCGASASRAGAGDGSTDARVRLININATKYRKPAPANIKGNICQSDASPRSQLTSVRSGLNRWRCEKLSWNTSGRKST